MDAESLGSTETFVNFYKTRWCHLPIDGNLHLYNLQLSGNGLGILI